MALYGCGDELCKSCCFLVFQSSCGRAFRRSSGKQVEQNFDYVNNGPADSRCRFAGPGPTQIFVSQPSSHTTTRGALRNPCCSRKGSRTSITVLVSSLNEAARLSRPTGRR